MSFAELLAHPSARLLTLALAHFLWQGFAASLLLVAIVEGCNIRRAASRYTCSLAALLVMVACPLATLAWLDLQADPFDHSVAATLADFPAATSSDRSWFDSRLLCSWIETAQPYALAAWVVGVVLFGGRLLGGAIGVARLRRGRLPLPAKLPPIVAQLGRHLGMNAQPLVFLSRQVAEAMAVGIVRPLVLIPAAWASEMPLDLLEAVIAHELAHLRRRDLWVNLLQRIVETVLFYHPAVWWLSRRLRVERELCADELAIAATGNRLAYAQALEQVAYQQQADIRPALAAFLRGEKDMRLLQRVRNVLGPAADDRSRLWPAGLIALAIPLGLWLASAGLGVATADDERDRERTAVERERSEKPGQRAVEIRFTNKEIRDDDDDDRDKPRRDGDRPRKEATRDGDGPRKPGPRDGEGPRKEGTRDGEASKPKFRDVDVVERKIVPKEVAEKERKKIQLDLDEALTRSKTSLEAHRIEELTVLVKRLSAQVEKLQDEVSSLRSRAAVGARDQALKDWRETYDKVEKKEVQPHQETEAQKKYFRAREEVEKVIAEKAKAVAEQQRAVAEKAAAETREQAEHAKLKKEEIRELIERKQAEVKRAAEAAIRKKLEALERENRDLTEEDLEKIKRKLRDDQTLLLDRELKEGKPALKEKPSLKEKPLLKDKPLKEKPSEQ